MTKDQYFEMCEVLGSEPLEEEIPVELADLPQEAQEALVIHASLQDQWDYMNGKYIGKNLNNFTNILLDIYQVPKEDLRLMYELVLEVDKIRAKIIKDSKPKDSAQ